MNKYRLISNALSLPVVQLLPVSILPKITKQKLILPFYHAINDVHLPHVSNLYKIRNINQFISDIDFLLKHFKPIDLHELIAIVKNKKKINDPCFHLTFDDGLSEFYHIIAPVLSEKGVPATCFLNSAFIDNKDLFFRYKESLIIDKLLREKISLKSIIKICEILEIKECAIEIFKNDILNINYSNKTKLNDIAEVLDIRFNDYLKDKKPYLSTKQIKSLIDKGFTFGAHSIDHPEYRFISIEEQIDQTVTSIKKTKEMFDLNYEVFSFPFTDVGVSKEFFNQIKADISFGCSGIKEDTIKNNLHRIPLEDSIFNARNRIKMEYLYYLLKKPFHKNIFERD